MDEEAATYRISSLGQQDVCKVSLEFERGDFVVYASYSTERPNKFEHNFIWQSPKNMVIRPKDKEKFFKTSLYM